MNNKKTVLSFFILFFITIPIWPQDASVEIEKSRNYYRQGMMTSALKSGVSALDLIAQRISGKLYSSIPEPQDMILFESNSFYSIAINNGYMDYNLNVEKTYSNANNLITLSFDTSPDNLIRVQNIVKTYEYINDKGGYKKFVVTNQKVEYSYLFLSDTLYIPYIIESRDDEVLSGILFKAKWVYLKNSTPSYREKEAVQLANDFLGKIRIRDLSLIMK